MCIFHHHGHYSCSMTEQGKAINHAREMYSTGLSSFAKPSSPLALRWELSPHREGSKQGHRIKISFVIYRICLASANRAKSCRSSLCKGAFEHFQKIGSPCSGNRCIWGLTFLYLASMGKSAALMNEAMCSLFSFSYCIAESISSCKTPHAILQLIDLKAGVSFSQAFSSCTINLT